MLDEESRALLSPKRRLPLQEPSPLASDTGEGKRFYRWKLI